MVQSFEHKQSTFAVYLELSNAFDTMELNILHTKLEHCELSLDWFISYLRNRKQYVTYMESNSDTRKVEYFSPFGSPPDEEYCGVRQLKWPLIVLKLGFNIEIVEVKMVEFTMCLIILIINGNKQLVTLSTRDNHDLSQWHAHILRVPRGLAKSICHITSILILI